MTVASLEHCSYSVISQPTLSSIQTEQDPSISASQCDGSVPLLLLPETAYECIRQPVRGEPTRIGVVDVHCRFAVAAGTDHGCARLQHGIGANGYWWMLSEQEFVDLFSCIFVAPLYVTWEYVGVKKKTE